MLPRAGGDADKLAPSPTFPTLRQSRTARSSPVCCGAEWEHRAGEAARRAEPCASKKVNKYIPRGQPLH
jgi:hypothetical protein